MFKPRRLWIAVICLLGVLIAIPVIFRLCWYPTTLRGKLDRIQFGMTEKEVKEILGEPGDYCTNLSGDEMAAQEWRLDGGEIKYRSYDPLTISPAFVVFDGPPPNLVWRFDEGTIIIDFDQSRRVNSKTRITCTNGASFWDQIWEWLPMQSGQNVRRANNW